MCARCNAGFTLDGSACQAYPFTCISGTTATENGNARQAFTCTCTSGTAGAGASGTFDAMVFGASGIEGFALNGNPCQAISCTCTSGTAAAGTSCTSEGNGLVQVAPQASR